MFDAAAATALPSHNHPEGIKGAQTAALSIFQTKQYKKQESFANLSEILNECAEFSGYDLNICHDSVVNKLDETCQGTVPVALWIIGQSKDSEDAVRRGVSFGQMPIRWELS